MSKKSLRLTADQKQLVFATKKQKTVWDGLKEGVRQLRRGDESGESESGRPPVEGAGFSRTEDVDVEGNS